jgi:hypothetical protein
MDQWSYELRDARPGSKKLQSMEDRGSQRFIVRPLSNLIITCTPLLPPQKLQSKNDIRLVIENMYYLMVFDHIQQLRSSIK